MSVYTEVTVCDILIEVQVDSLREQYTLLYKHSPLKDFIVKALDPLFIVCVSVLGAL